VVMDDATSEIYYAQPLSPAGKLSIS